MAAASSAPGKKKKKKGEEDPQEDSFRQQLAFSIFSWHGCELGRQQFYVDMILYLGGE